MLDYVTCPCEYLHIKSVYSIHPGIHYIHSKNKLISK